MSVPDEKIYVTGLLKKTIRFDKLGEMIPIGAPEEKQVFDPFNNRLPNVSIGLFQNGDIKLESRNKLGPVSLMYPSTPWATPTAGQYAVGHKNLKTCIWHYTWKNFDHLICNIRIEGYHLSSQETKLEKAEEVQVIDPTEKP